MKTNRKDQLARTAQSRALVFAHLNNAESALSVKDLLNDLAEPLAALQIGEKPLRALLDRAAKSGLITKGLLEDQVVFFRKGSRRPGIEIETKDPDQSPKIAGGKQKRPNAKAPKDAAPALTLDIVKSTGRIRLEVGGFVIDIGIRE